MRIPIETSRKFRLSTLATACILGMQFPVSAQDASSEEPNADKENVQIERIEVTSRFRSEYLQDVGQSIRAFSGDDLETSGMLNFDDIARRTPGLDFSNGGPGRNTPRIRGVSNSLFLQDLVVTQPLVSASINNIPIVSPGFNQPDLNLTDLNRVEVLRGPQGTLFGEGAAGGAIRYFTAEPSFDATTADVSFSYFSTDDGGQGYRSSATANTPVSASTAVRLTVYRNDDDGFIDRFDGEENINDVQSTGGRIALKFAPENSPLEINLFSIFDSMDIGAEYFISGDPEELTYGNPAPSGRDEDFHVTGLQIDYLFEDYTLTSITGFLDREVNSGPNWDVFTNFLPSFGLGFITDPVLGTSFTKTESITQELRLVSDFTGPLNFTAGIFYRDTEFTNFNDKRVDNLVGTIEAVFGPGGAGPFGIVDDTFILTDEFQQQEQLSFFLDMSYEFNDKWTGYAGVRSFEEDIVGFITDGVGGANPQGDNETDISAVLPRFSLEYRQSDYFLYYLSYSEGARNGGFNSPFTANLFPNPDAVATFDEDKVKAYEFGIKSTLLDGAMTLNGALYKSNFEDMQIFLREPQLGTALTGNGPDADITGIEIELAYRITENFTITAGGNNITAEFAEDLDLGAGQNIGDGDRLSYVPKSTYTLSAEYLYPLANGNLSVYADFQRIGDRVDIVETQTTLDSYENASVRIGYQTESWSVTLYGNNLTNELPILAAGLEGTAVGTPRQIGLTFTSNFEF